jgi:hypothetical protein
MQGEPLLIFGDREQTHALSYVVDIIPGDRRRAVDPRARAARSSTCVPTCPYTVNDLAATSSVRWTRPTTA